ncbi:MAG TPA: hypothetical protein VMA09_22325 [Candidatus Binataceae bacterium]|nr:hypothetical protein [Candidatus Binataceae bacterium]
MFGHEPVNVFALDRNHALSLLCECPGKNFAASAAAQHEEIAFFHGFLPFVSFSPLPQI